MKTLIVYYSRTGTTRKLALALADKLGAATAEIRCKRYRPGIFRYLRAGYDSVQGNLPPIEMPQTHFPDYDLVLIGAPIWTSHPALPIRAFLGRNPTLPARVALFLTYGGHSPAAQAFAEMAAVLPHGTEASLALREKDVRDGTITEAVEGFVATLVRGGPN